MGCPVGRVGLGEGLKVGTMEGLRVGAVVGEAEGREATTVGLRVGMVGVTGERISKGEGKR